MTVVKQYRVGGGSNGGGGNPFGLIGGIIMLVIGLALGYFILSGLLTLLYWMSPILLLSGIAVDPKGSISLGKSFINLSKKNPLIPVGIVILSALAFPLVPGVIAALTGGFLLSKYFVKKKIKKVFNQHAPQEQPEDEEEFAEYEEVIDDEEFLKLPPLEPKGETKTKTTNEYDDLF